MNTFVVLGWSWLLVFSIIFLISYYKLCKIYHHKIIKKRGGLLIYINTLLLCGLVCIDSYFISAHDAHKKKCFHVLTCFRTSIYLATMTSFAMRCCNLYGNYIHVKYMVEDKLSESRIKKWIETYRNENKAVLHGIIVASIQLLIYNLAVNLNQPSSHHDDHCNHDWGNFIVAIYESVLLVLFLYVTFHLRKIRDNYNISRELKITSIIWAIGFTIWCIAQFVIPHSVHIPVQIISSVLCATVLYIFTVFYSIRQVNDYENSSSRHNKAISIIDTLRAPKLREEFKQFLMSEFSVEHLLFFEDVSILRYMIKNKYPPSKIKKTVVELYYIYIAEDCGREINVSYELRNQTYEYIQKNYNVKLNTSIDTSTNKVVPLNIGPSSVIVPSPPETPNTSNSNAGEPKYGSLHISTTDSELSSTHNLDSALSPTGRVSLNRRSFLDTAQSDDLEASFHRDTFLVSKMSNIVNYGAECLNQLLFNVRTTRFVSTVFDECIIAVIKLLDNDSFVRFIRILLSKPHHNNVDGLEAFLEV